MKVLAIIILTLYSITSFSQIRVLENIDFSDNDFKLVFINQRGNESSQIFSDSIKNFMISNKEMLIELQKSWIGYTETDEILECGYDYIIYVLKKEKIVGQLNVNLNCGYVLALGIGKTCLFKNNPFENLTIDKKIYTRSLLTNDVSKAKRLHNLLKTTKGIHYQNIKENIWLNYDGNAYIEIMAKNNSLKKAYDIKSEFNDRYGNVNQHIDFWGFSEHNYSGNIYCNSSFYDKLTKEKFDWADYNVMFREKSWKSWGEENKMFFAFIFSENEDLLNNLN